MTSCPNPGAGPTGRSLLGLAWPLMISFTTRSVLTSIDIPFGSMIGDAAVAAIGLAFPLEFAFIACWVGLSGSLTSHLSRAFGEANEGRIRQLVRATGRIVLVLAACFFALAGLVWFAAPRLPVDPAVARNFQLYGPIVVAGAAIAGFWSVLPDSIVKAHHDTRATMVAGLLTAFTNLGLNALFVIVFGWGIVGIAVATGFARAGGLAYALARARSLEAARRAALRTGAPLPERPPLERPYRALLVLAVPTALSFVLVGTENLVVNAILAHVEHATANLAAYAIYHRASFLFLMPVVAIGVAIVPYVSRAVGAGRLDQVRSGVRDALLFAAAHSLLVVGPLCYLAARPIALWLGDAKETEDMALFAIRWAVPAGVLASSPFALCRPVFEGFQRGMPGLAMGALRYVALSIPLAIAGSRLAASLGRPAFEGAIAGLLASSGVVSVLFIAWTARLVREPGAKFE